MSFLRRLFEKKEPDRFDDPLYRADLQILKELDENGVALSEEQECRHYLYFAKEEAARSVDTELRREGFTTEVKPAAAGPLAWLVLATRMELLLPPGNVKRLRDELTALVVSSGGEYDGWEVKVDATSRSENE